MKSKSSHQLHKKRSLDSEEEALWHQVKRTVAPMDGKRQNLKHWLDLEEASFSQNPKPMKKVPILNDKVPVSKASITRSFYAAPYTPPVSVPSKPGLASSIDDNTARKLLKGRVSIDGRIDLHGMTQTQAHNVLKNFLIDSYHSGFRMVLVITGKGRMNEGVLKNAVPNWLNEPALSLYASAFRRAHVTHGGEGALYVRIRKRENWN
ncbi:MAG: Smr/MutS family protein [Salaquimonas sp.]